MIRWNRAARRRRRFDKKRACEAEAAAWRIITGMARTMLGGFRFDRTPNPAWRSEADYIVFDPDSPPPVVTDQLTPGEVDTLCHAVFAHRLKLEEEAKRQFVANGSYVIFDQPPPKGAVFTVSVGPAEIPMAKPRPPLPRLSRAQVRGR